MSDPVEVRHNESRSRFETDVDGGTAFCAYERIGDLMRLHHTEVPRAAEGRGIASKVVRAALEHAASHGLRVVPACSYVRNYMSRHPDTHALLAPDVQL